MAIWKCALESNGKVYAAILGEMKTQKLFAINWDSQQLVLSSVISVVMEVVGLASSRSLQHCCSLTVHVLNIQEL